MGLKPIPAVNQAKKQSLQFEVASEQLNFKIFYMLINYTIAHNGHFFVQLLPAHDKQRWNLARKTKTDKKNPKKVQEKVRAIIGQAFRFFTFWKQIGKNRKAQPGATRNEERNTKKKLCAVGKKTATDIESLFLHYNCFTP